MRISVILPVYNRTESLVSALRSVLDQSRPADEIVVVDDGSTEDIAGTIATFSGRVILIRQENAGVAAARNAGAERASGDWLAFQDSDDLWTPDHLAAVERDLLRAGPEIVAHLGDVTYEGRDYSERLFAIKGRTFPAGKAQRVADPLPLVISGMTLQAAAIRADVFSRLGKFDQTMRMLSDTAFFCRLALEGPFLVTGDVMAVIRRLEGDEDSITSLHRKNAIYARKMHVRLLAALLPLNLSPHHRSMIARMLSGAEFRLAQALYGTDKRKARQLLRRAAARHPRPVVGWIKTILATLLGVRGFRIVLGHHKPLDRS